MNPEIKKDWLAALRSGQYVQGKDYLHTIDNKFCCVGVLADILHKKGLIPEPVLDIDNSDTFAYCGHPTMLPKKILIGLGVFDEDTPAYIGGNLFCLTDLAERNDRGETFEEIAEVIEKTL
jgi:hypothetical protein